LTGWTAARYWLAALAKVEGLVPTVEERLAYLEGRVEEHSRGFGELRELVIHLDQKVDRFREELLGADAATNARIDALDQRLSGRIEALDQKVDRFREELAGRIEALDQRLSGRIEALDQKVDRFREELAGRIEALDQKVDRFREELAGRIEALDQKVSRQFVWLVGIQVMVLLAVIGALLGK
jgi:chromosome segregation ATPase